MEARWWHVYWSPRMPLLNMVAIFCSWEKSIFSSVRLIRGFPTWNKQVNLFNHYTNSMGGDVAEWFRALDLKSRSLFKSSTLPVLSLTPHPHCVSSQLVNLPPVGSPNSLCSIWNICLLIYTYTISTTVLNTIQHKATVYIEMCMKN